MPRTLSAARGAIALTHAVGAHTAADRLTYWANRLVIARLNGGPSAVRLNAGPLCVIPLSTHDLRNVALIGDHEPEVAEFARTVVRHGEVVVDVGAHIGINTLIFANLVGPTGKVHAFEPNTEAADVLRTSVALNQFGDRVSLHEAAVGDATGETTLFLGEHGGLTNSTVPGWADATKSRTVPVVTLDHTLLPVLSEPIGLLKIDVEGAEAAVLDGARQMLNEFPPRAMIVEVSSKVNATDVLRRLADYGYGGWDESSVPTYTGAGFGRDDFEFVNVCAVRAA